MTEPIVPDPAANQAEVVLKEEGAHAAYANFARVTATPEEVIIDFGLNPNPFLNGRQEVKSASASSSTSTPPSGC